MGKSVYDDLVSQLCEPCWGASAHEIDDQRRLAAEAIASLQSDVDALKKRIVFWDRDVFLELQKENDELKQKIKENKHE